MGLQTSGGSETRVRGLKNGVTVWERLVSGMARKLAVDCGFVAVATSEVHVLRLSDGGLLLPPLALNSAVVVLKLKQESFLLALCRDASLYVWDLATQTCLAQTSLATHCAPGDVELLGVKPGTGEPFVRLLGGRVLLFHKELKSWMVLSSADVHAEVRPDSLSASTARRQTLRLESDLIVAACLGEVDLFKDHLEDLCWHLASEDVGLLRRWLSVVLKSSQSAAGNGESKDDRRKAVVPLLAVELEKLKLDSDILLREVVLPVLRAVPSAQGLLGELERVETGAEAEPIF